MLKELAEAPIDESSIVKKWVACWEVWDNHPENAAEYKKTSDRLLIQIANLPCQSEASAIVRLALILVMVTGFYADEDPGDSPSDCLIQSVMTFLKNRAISL